MKIGPYLFTPATVSLVASLVQAGPNKEEPVPTAFNATEVNEVFKREIVKDVAVQRRLDVVGKLEKVDDGGDGDDDEADDEGDAILEEWKAEEAYKMDELLTGKLEMQDGNELSVEEEFGVDEEFYPEPTADDDTNRRHLRSRKLCTHVNYEPPCPVTSQFKCGTLKYKKCARVNGRRRCLWVSVDQITFCWVREGLAPRTICVSKNAVFKHVLADYPSSYCGACVVPYPGPC